MNSSFVHRIARLYPLLLILCGIGYAKYAPYNLDGDAVAFMDIADQIRAHNLPLVINGYWNPAYAATLAIGETIAHPSRWNELQTFYWVNFVIFVACIFACVYFVRGIVLVRDLLCVDRDNPPALSPPALILTALALLFFSFQRELSLGDVRADALLLFFFFLAASFLLRLQATGRFVFYPLLGLALGFSYLTKSFAFLPSGFLLAGIFVYGLRNKTGQRKRILSGAILSGVVFAALAGPYIAGISKQRGRPTTGESARLNYAFFIDQTDRWHEARSGKLGHATAVFKHPEQVILDTPAIYSFAVHPYGTFPLWFDPSFYTDTITPHFWLKGHLQRLARCTALLVRYLVGHMEPLLFLLVLLAAGASFARKRSLWLPLLPVSLWGLLMVGIYFPIDLQDRYLTGAYLLFLLPILAMVRRRSTGPTGEIATGLALLMALFACGNAVSEIAERRRIDSVTGYPRGAYSKQIYPAAKGINDMGIGPGSTVACLGDDACYVDHYWARLAGTPIRAEIQTIDNAEPSAFWSGIQDKQKVIEALRDQHVAAIVSLFAPSAHVPEGWQQLGKSNFYAYRL